VYHQIILIIHLLAASIWVGGHLFLVLRILPATIQQNDISILSSFRAKFSKIGMPSLFVLFVTGVLMAYYYDVTVTKWFSFSSPIEKIVSTKLLLLFISLIIAIHTQKFVFPKLTSESMLLAVIEITLVTIIGATMLILGSLVRIGGI
jgi:putative copper export protein